jgi:hypothetical protein
MDMIYKGALAMRATLLDGDKKNIGSDNSTLKS